MNLFELFLGTLKESLFIILIIFSLMIIIELVVLKYKDKILKFAYKNKFLSYIVSSFFGSIPGCVGTFAMDSLYMAGLIGFGGIISVMIATSGDEAIMMISMIISGELSASSIITLIITLFILGIFGGYLADKFIKKKDLCKNCQIKIHKNQEFKLKHFIKEHIYVHILKKHIWKIFLWLFSALFIIELIKPLIDTSIIFSGVNLFYILIIASLIGILPISGPNIFLLVLFSQGLIPFSILLANSIIQDGHGLLPILGYSWNDAIKIKTFNFIFGISIGIILLMFGL